MDQLTQNETSALRSWEGMTLQQLCEHAGWVWYDYTHPNGRRATVSKEYAHRVRDELARRERAETNS